MKVEYYLKDLTLGKLVALSKVAELSAKENRTEDDTESLLEGLGTITGYSVGQLKVMSQKDYQKLFDVVQVVYTTALTEFIQVLNEKRMRQVIEAPRISEVEETLMLATVIGWWQKQRVQRSLKKDRKFRTFIVSDDPANEPSQIWAWLLDGSFRNIQQIPDDKPHLHWEHIPAVLAAIAWERDETRHGKDAHGKLCANMDRVFRMQDSFLESNALAACEVYNFFLTTMDVSLIDRNTRPSLKK